MALRSAHRCRQVLDRARDVPIRACPGRTSSAFALTARETFDDAKPDARDIACAQNVDAHVQRNTFSES